MSDGPDDLDRFMAETFTPEEIAAIEARNSDAYTIIVDVPSSKITDAQLDDLYDAIGEVVDAWESHIPGRDWDAHIYGHGPMRRRPE